MRGQRDVSAQLLHELTLTAAEAVRLPPRGHENPENLALNQQWRRHQRMQAAPRQLLQERHLHPAEVWLVHQVPAHAARQTALREGKARLPHQSQFQRQPLAAGADAGDGQHLVGRVVETETPEIDRQVVLQTANDDLEDALQVQPLADGARDAVQQVEPAQLRLQLLLGLFALRDVP